MCQPTVKPFISAKVKDKARVSAGLKARKKQKFGRKGAQFILLRVKFIND